jgi:para-nitrobenzyl esterase
VILASIALVRSKDPTVTLSSGTVLNGKICSGFEKQGIRCFLGIPYAEPPINENRFRPPLPFNYTGIESLDTTSSGAKCYQGAALKPSEDCLFLDVYAPPEGVAPKAVMVWIHGGCFTMGGPNNYPGSDLVDTADVLVVVIHYRLGVFGYLGADQLRERDEEDHTTGNYATLDALMSLKWIQDYASSFGPVPEKITVFGQSSGACSVAQVIAVPEKFATYKGKKLFTSAIMESGGFNQWASTPMKVAQQQYADIMAVLECSIDDVDCLIGKTAKEVQSAFGTASPGLNPRCRDAC